MTDLISMTSEERLRYLARMRKRSDTGRSMPAVNCLDGELSELDRLRDELTEIISDPAPACALSTIISELGDVIDRIRAASQVTVKQMSPDG